MTKTKRFSRIITFALAMLMVVAMAVPAFAAEPTMRAGTSPIGQGRINLNGYGDPYANGRLNILGTGGAYAGQTVNLWEKTYSDDQVWEIVRSRSSGNYGFIYQSQLSATGVRLAVNAYHPYGTASTYAVTLQPTINNVADTELVFSLSGPGNRFTAWLAGGTAAYCNLYIDLSNPASSRSDVFFHNNTKNPNAYWYWI